MTKVRSSDLSAAAEALAAARLRRLPRPDQVRSDGAITRLSRRVPAVPHDSLQVLLDEAWWGQRWLTAQHRRRLLVVCRSIDDPGSEQTGNGVACCATDSDRVTKIRDGPLASVGSLRRERSHRCPIAAGAFLRRLKCYEGCVDDLAGE